MNLRVDPTQSDGQIVAILDFGCITITEIKDGPHNIGLPSKLIFIDFC